MQPSGPVEKKIDAQAAGQLNGVSAKTVKRWAESGMPHFKIRGKYLFYQSQIEEFLRSTYGVNQNVIPMRRASGGIA